MSRSRDFERKGISSLSLSRRVDHLTDPKGNFFAGRIDGLFQQGVLNGQREGASKFEGSYSSRCRDRSVKSTDRAPCYASTIKFPSFSFSRHRGEVAENEQNIALSGSDKRQGLFDWIILKFQWSVQDVGREFHSLFFADRRCHHPLSLSHPRKKERSGWNWSARLCVTFIYGRK